MEEFEMFESMRIYIERHGRPYNYLQKMDFLNAKREEHLNAEEVKMNNEAAEVKAKKEDQERRQKEHLE